MTFWRSKKKHQKKRRLINASEQKLSIDKSKPKTVYTSTLDYSREERLPILIPKAKISIFATKKINIDMIDTNAYCTTCKLEWAQVFAVSMTNLEYQAKKKARLETDLKSVIFKEFHDLLNVFSKKNLDILLLYWKYDHKIILEEK